MNEEPKNEEKAEDWVEISITVKTADIDTAGAIANMVVPYGIYIEDYSALEAETKEIAHIDLIEESLLKRDREHGIIHVYVNPHENPLEAVSFIRDRLTAVGIDFDIKISDCKAEDWVNNWKRYFHPMEVGEKLLIRPVWDEPVNADGRVVLNIEPGLAFGTGSHPTTRLCLETLERYVSDNSTVLDMGCGSGILSVASLLLGAKSALGVDIDKLAVKTAKENAEKNGFGPDRFNAVAGNLANCVSGKFSIVIANIVADVILDFNREVGAFLESGGVYITGGIIDGRTAEVEASFKANGFEIAEHGTADGWNVYVCFLPRSL